MKKYLFLVLCLLSTNVLAWNVVKYNDEMFLSDTLLNEKIKVFALSTDTPVEVIDLGKNIIVLRYLESISGTKDTTETFNCSVFNKLSKKMIGIDQLCKTVTVAVGGKKTVTNAVFKLDQDSVGYAFEELTARFPL